MAYAMATAMAMIARIPTTTYRVHGLPVQSSIPHRPLAARGESLASHRDGRGAPPARRDDREYREYLKEEQRSRRGCIARRMQPDFHHGLLGLAADVALHRHALPAHVISDRGQIVDAGGVDPGVVEPEQREHRDGVIDRLAAPPHRFDPVDVFAPDEVRLLPP